VGVFLWARYPCTDTIRPCGPSPFVSPYADGDADAPGDVTDVMVLVTDVIRTCSGQPLRSECVSATWSDRETVPASSFM